MSVARRAEVFVTDVAAGERSLDDGEFVDVHAVPVEDSLDVARTDPVHERTLLPLLLAVGEGPLDAE